MNEGLNRYGLTQSDNVISRMLVKLFGGENIGGSISQAKQGYQGLKQMNLAPSILDMSLFQPFK